MSDIPDDAQELLVMIEQLQIEVEGQKCSACAGDGKPVSGLPCICGGSGKASDEADGLRQVLYDAQKEVEALSANYNELIMAVAQKWPGESRHETALRYIVEREDMQTDSEDGHQQKKGEDDE